VGVRGGAWAGRFEGVILNVDGSNGRQFHQSG